MIISEDEVLRSDGKLRSSCGKDPSFGQELPEVGMKSLMLDSFLFSKRHALAITAALTIIWIGRLVLMLLSP
jgi:hypothetical protein